MRTTELMKDPEVVGLLLNDDKSESINKLQAIKAYNDKHQCGLPDAKAWVDMACAELGNFTQEQKDECKAAVQKYLKTQPAPAAASPNSGCMGTVVVVFGIIVTLISMF